MTAKGSRNSNSWPRIARSEDPGTHNQALMEFGALVCTPKNPKCKTCVFKNLAMPYKMNDQLPYRENKETKNQKTLFQLSRINHEGFTHQRNENQKDIWQNLFEFPLHETKDDIRSRY